MKNTNKITLSTSVERSLLERFDRNFPHCRSRFISNAMEMALNDRKVFDNIFFRDIISNDSLSNNI